jgi:dTDP-4-amino-4,6-dideoxygalactose transaminase
VDSCRYCFNLDAGDAARKATARTKAIVPVHLFGQSADMDAILALASERGSRHRGRRASMGATAGGGRRHGAFGMFSLFPSKNLGLRGRRDSRD